MDFTDPIGTLDAARDMIVDTVGQLMRMEEEYDAIMSRMEDLKKENDMLRDEGLVVYSRLIDAYRLIMDIQSVATVVFPDLVNPDMAKILHHGMVIKGEVSGFGVSLESEPYDSLEDRYKDVYVAGAGALVAAISGAISKVISDALDEGDQIHGELFSIFQGYNDQENGGQPEQVQDSEPDQGEDKSG